MGSNQSGLPPSRPQFDHADCLEFVRQEAGTSGTSSSRDSATRHCPDHDRLTSAVTSIAKELDRAGLTVGRCANNH